MKIPKSMESFFAWRCGYATGLRVARQIVEESKDPETRLHREIESAVAAARELRQEVDSQLN